MALKKKTKIMVAVKYLAIKGVSTPILRAHKSEFVALLRHYTLSGQKFQCPCF